MLLPSNAEPCPCSGPDMDGVAVHVLVPLKSSADDRVVVPLLPPASSTEPLATIEAGKIVAECPTRADVIVPALVQVPLLVAGSKMSAVASTAEPFLPP